MAVPTCLVQLQVLPTCLVQSVPAVLVFVKRSGRVGIYKGSWYSHEWGMNYRQLPGHSSLGGVGLPTRGARY